MSALFVDRLISVGPVGGRQVGEATTPNRVSTRK